MRKILLFSVFALALCSCKGLLDENPQAISSLNYYNTPEEIQAGVNAIYSGFRNTNVFGAVYIAMRECKSDLWEKGRNTYLPISQYTALSSTGITRAGTVWTQLYTSIRNANIVIQKIPEASETSEADKNLLMAEARFLRGLGYMHLVRTFGAIPLRTEANMDEIECPRSPVSEVYSFILEDLKFAEQYLPETVATRGHPTKYSAKTALADVYFFTNDYASAAAKTKEVMSSGKYSLVEISSPDEFDLLYGPGVNTAEEVFYLRYNTEDGFGLVTYYHGTDKMYTLNSGYLSNITNKNYPAIAEWDDADFRKTYDLYTYKGLDATAGEGALLCNKFRDTGSENARNSCPMYKYSDVLLMYAEASCRAQNGPTAEGMEAVNMVHRRAYGKPSTEKSDIDYNLSDYTKDSFIDLCLKERGYETFGEGKRWLDIIRAGKEVELVRKYRNASIEQSAYLWPIPVVELQTNKAITEQNPGY